MRNQSFISNHCKLSFCKDVSLHLMRLLLLTIILSSGFSIWAAELSSVALTTTPQNAVLIGNPVTLMATATGGTSLQYQFMSGTSLMRSFSSARTFIFTPTVAKTYTLTVIARDISGVDPNATVTSSVVNFAAKPALTAVSLTTTPPNAVLVGTPVTLTATPAGGANVQYQFMTGVSLMRSFASDNTFSFTPTIVRNYTFSVIARDLSAVDPNATVTSSTITFAVKPALTAISLTSLPLKAVLVGKSFTLTATPTGGANVQYKFMTGTSLVRNFASDNTFSFTPTVVRTYSFTVIARDLSGVDPNATVTSSVVNLDVKPALTAVSLTSTPLNAVLVNTPFTLTATPTGGANVQYQFMAGTSLVRSFASDNTFSFTPTVIRSYSFTVFARDLSGDDPNATVTSSVINLDVKPALTAVSLTSAPLNAILVGKPFILTATPTGGANVQYQFMAGTSLVRSFASDNTFSYTPTVVRNYTFTVIARDLSGADPNATVTSSVITLAIRPALTAVSLTTTPLNAALVGAPITLTATVDGGANVQYQFMTGTSLMRNFASDNTFSFTSTAVKTYTFTVIVHDLGGTDPNATVTSSVITLAIRPALTAVSLTTTPLNTTLVGTPVTLTATPAGGVNVQYKFMAGTTQLRSFSTSNSYTFTPATANNYNFSVVASDLGGADPNITFTSATVNYAVTSPLPPTITSFTPASGLIGTVVTITGTNFIGATAVKFNGISAATYTVVSATSITATVPAGATTGNIAVTTAINTATSTTSFIVIPPAPAITSFTPVSGPVGTIVTITGTNLSGTTAVKFNGVTVTTITDNTATTLKAAVPNGSTTGKITVTTAGGTATSAVDFIVMPTITSFTPASGVVGTVVTITGTNLTGTTSVKFNGISSLTITNISATSLTATVPIGATTGKISVTNPDGTANSANDFIVMPAITSFTPISGVVGTIVTITGTNFTGTTSVKFNGTSSLVITNITATSLTATVPIGATTGKISVTNPDGSANSANDFIVMPAITSFTPTSGVVGTIVTITGTNLSGTTAVKFNGVTVTTITENAATTLKAAVPNGATTGKITVTTPGGTATSATDFIVFPTPTISSFTPTTGTFSQVVTINGTNFTGTTAVKFNGTMASAFTVLSATSITATLSNKATTGKITVTTPDGIAASTMNFTVIPNITSFNPINGNMGQAVTITGTNFTDAIAVKFNNIAATYTVDSATSITAVVPTGATTGKITVTTVDGTASSVTDFNVTSSIPMVWVPGGTFTMGSTDGIGRADEKIAHQVTLSGYWMYKYEVTVAQYLEFCTSTSRALPVFPSGFSWANKPTGWNDPTIQQHPIVNVSWNDAKAFADWAGVKLPTEAQWEYAARGPLSSNYPWGGTATVSDLFNSWNSTKCANYYNSFNMGISTWPVGSFLAGASWCGVNDLSGNVGEWCADWYGASYASTPVNNPIGPISGNSRVLRGGSWMGSEDISRCTSRGSSDPNSSDYTLGFRCILTSDTPISFTPSIGITGTIVSITGTNLTGATSVKFNGIAATTFIVAGNTSITAIVPSGVTTGKIVVTTPTGTVTSGTDFTIYQPPTIISFTPTSGSLTQSVTITGTNFIGATDVKFNGISVATFTVNSQTSITTTVPGDAMTGKISIIAPGGTATSVTDFTVYRPPTITNFTPISGVVGTSVTITGTNFSSVTAVKFNSTIVTTFTIYSATSIIAIVPTGATNGKISVTNPDGTANSVGNFIVMPAITSFTPISGVVGTVVTITGTNLAGTTSIKFNGVSSLTITNITATSLTVTVPVGAITGKISVTNPDGTAISTNDFIVMPAITSFTPIRGVVGTVVTITGTNLTGTTSVKFNGTSSLTITNITATSLKAIVPVGATTGKISVTNPDGTAISTNDYVVIIEKINSIDGATMVWVPGSTFTMGSIDGVGGFNEHPAHQVTLSGYWIYKYDVTVAQYRAFCTATSRALPSFPTGYSWTGKSGWTDSALQQHPIVNVSWTACKAYADWASVSLPTEAQWEYAARGSQGNNYPWGGTATANDAYSGWDQSKCANSYNSSAVGKSTWPVGYFPAGTSWCGAQDMAGNVCQWCGDWYGSYSSLPVTNPTGPASGTYRVMRGSSWYNGDNYYYRGAYRDYEYNPGNYLDYVGFRCAVPVPNPPNITYFTPTSGLIGTVVTITGTNLAGTTAVKFNGTLATTFTVTNATSITATVPVGTTTGKVSVTTPDGTANSVDDFIVMPVITSFLPISGFVGTVVTITGTNLAGTTSVKFDGTSSLTITNITATSLKAIVPVGATTGKISVTNTDGSAISTNNFVINVEKINPTDSADMVWVPGGTFTMGSINGVGNSNEHPAHQVTLSGYWIYKSDVTVAQYRAFCTATSRTLPYFPTGYSWTGKSGWDDPALQQHPIVNVTWYDCKAYADWYGVALPTEAQWEYASRGPQGNNYPWGGAATANDAYNGWDSSKCANYYNSYAAGKSTWPVGNFPLGVSWCGAQDMAGNVWQWCADWYGSYSSTPVTNPTGPSSGSYRMLRGGSWRDYGYIHYDADFNYYDGYIRGAYRDYPRSPVVYLDNIGFRCAVPAPNPPTITSFTPISGLFGQVVTIIGTNLTGVTGVKFNGTVATSITNITATSLKVTVPDDATTGKISVTTPGGTAISADNFTVDKIAGTLSINLKDNAAMVWVPGGSFTMGTPYDNRWTPATQQVTLSGYWIYKYDVTVSQYRAFCAATSRALPSFPIGYSWAGLSDWSASEIQQHPIVNVTWSDCKAYADWDGVTLPTEAQWEYASRGPQGNNYPWGGTATVNDPYNGWDQSKCANSYNSRAVGKSTWPVGSFPTGASWCGAQDMTGNVWQWCADYDGNYSSSPVTNPTGPASGNYRVLRGGSWYNGIYSYRGACRSDYYPNYDVDYGIGFRCTSPGP